MTGFANDTSGISCLTVPILYWQRGGLAVFFYSEGYPAAHTGCLGLALEAGARAINLTEFQYGICAVGLSLTMNGAYQTALPRYISVDEDGKAREFSAFVF